MLSHLSGATSNVGNRREAWHPSLWQGHYPYPDLWAREGSHARSLTSCDQGKVTAMRKREESWIRALYLQPFLFVWAFTPSFKKSTNTVDKSGVGP
jgi:hypothetical protein